MPQHAERRFNRIPKSVLDRLAMMAEEEDRADRFDRLSRWAAYEGRDVCVALCQGAADHFVSGAKGVKDIDVWTLFACADEALSARWRTERVFDVDPYCGYCVDFMVRSWSVGPKADGADTLIQFLATQRTASARALARASAVLLEPAQQRGRIVWPQREGASK